MEYRKRGDGMVIKIIGSNCRNGIKLKKMVTKYADDCDNVEVKILDNEKDRIGYQVKNIPGLIINDQLVSQGKVLTVREISRLVNEATPA